MNVILRKAHVSEATSIVSLVNYYAERDLMLPKSLMDVYEQLREFVVALDDDGRMVGCGALRIMGVDLAEVRSVAIIEEARGHGVGRRIVERLVDEAAELGLTRIFSLTYQVNFFGKLGFEVVPRAIFPEKVWLDCKDCRKRSCCDEVAMVRVLGAKKAADTFASAQDEAPSPPGGNGSSAVEVA